MITYKDLWNKLKSKLQEKTSWGKNEILRIMEGMEVMVEEKEDKDDNKNI